ncbi:MAG: hypothetical protein AUH29_09415 [Candidatus Rokubacteria bacterium 13_1_40CM_69_27]|nr:MAG: hypothetical protein AUH29_09415 [Candidatus Rokubacteria bacterium 13_1_40CM_69_27]OLC39669.1 MAG: hypothetical protein AUH81_01105 [Candidatus Rokubacteria bacterium 13_1_40CM_4_69_5]
MVVGVAEPISQHVAVSKQMHSVDPTETATRNGASCALCGRRPEHENRGDDATGRAKTEYATQGGATVRRGETPELK